MKKQSLAFGWRGYSRLNKQEWYSTGKKQIVACRPRQAVRNNMSAQKSPFIYSTVRVIDGRIITIVEL